VLRTRGQMPLRIETEYDLPGNACLLFEGYTGRVEAIRRVSASATYPSSEWRDYEVQCVGKWQRLQESFFWFRPDWTDSKNSPTPFPDPTVSQPWRVTDIIRTVLNQIGFLDSQIDVFDDPIYLFANPEIGYEGLVTPTPGTNVHDFLISLARDYLNAYLLWDMNAGQYGMWRLLRPPDGTEPILANFVTAPPDEPLRQVHKAVSYGINTYPILGPHAFATYTVPPEGNLLTVTGATQDTKGGPVRLMQTFFNRDSFTIPGYPPANPDGLDYLGRLVNIAYTDPTLTLQSAVDWVGRRVFNLACRGQKYARFTAELVLAAPGDSVYTHRHRRPLRIGDAVTLDGDRWIVRSCNPAYRKDHLQMAEYELQFFRPALEPEVEWAWH
jgi:hypothetical protein